MEPSMNTTEDKPAAESDTPTVEEIRKAFPTIGETGKNEGNRGEEETPFIYLDSAATALTPLPVIEAVDRYYRTNSTNIHRGLYRRSEEATELYEESRAKVARFLSASSPGEIIFTHGATESINLLAYSWADRLGPEDTVVATEMEHHANLVPWQELARRRGTRLEFIPVDPKSGTLKEEEIETVIHDRTALVAVTGMSNVTGVRPPIEKIAARARTVGAKVLLDASQLAAHERIDLRILDIDFLVFSGHKLYGPTGVGVLWSRSGLLEGSPPFLSGGDMIEQVSLEKSTFRRPPYRFEAGTPHIAGVAGLSAALDFISSVGWEAIKKQESLCAEHLLSLLADFKNVEVYGPVQSSERSAVVSFNISNVHPHDAGTLLSERGIAVRAGLHCAQPYVESLGARGTVRASIGMYTTIEEIEALREGLKEVSSVFP
ncbi:MAG: aminotransferase class V-fold PLP-dependent enzyme [Spirochaetaceae bacterium]